MLQKNIIEIKGQLIAGTSCRIRNGENFSQSLGSDDISESLTNRKILFKALSLSLECAVFPQQVHGTRIETIFSKEKGCGAFEESNAIAQCDALITSEKGITLCIQTADCHPIFIFDQEKNIIALVHAGWRGTQNKIISKTLQHFIDQYNSDTQKIIVSFGSGILSCCYEVSPNFQNSFSSEVIYENNGKYYLDMVKENTVQSLDMGVLDSNILTKSCLCTFCHEEFFYSYRRDGEKSGRMLSFFTLL